MNFNKRNRDVLARGILLGSIHAGEEISFAGVDNNFEITPAVTSPLAGDNKNVPPPGGNLPPHQISGIDPTKQVDNQGNDVIVDGKVIKPEESASPLDPYKDLWDNTKTKEQIEAEKKPKTSLDLDVEQFRSGADKLNFMEGVSEESLSGIHEGGEKGVAALQEILGIFGKNIFAYSAKVASGLAKENNKVQNLDVNSQVAITIKETALLEQVVLDNPNLNNPAYKSMVERTIKQIVKKFPAASPVDLKKLGLDYFNNLIPKAETQEEIDKKKVEKEEESEFDWAKIFNS